jgi:hypothetical protein
MRFRLQLGRLLDMRQRILRAALLEQHTRQVRAHFDVHTIDLDCAHQRLFCNLVVARLPC